MSAEVRQGEGVGIWKKGSLSSSSQKNATNRPDGMRRNSIILPPPLELVQARIINAAKTTG